MPEDTRIPHIQAVQHPVIWAAKFIEKVYHTPKSPTEGTAGGSPRPAPGSAVRKFSAQLAICFHAFDSAVSQSHYLIANLDNSI
jgi:hypothetical protein